MDLSPTTSSSNDRSPTGKKYRFGGNSPIRNIVDESNHMEDEGLESNHMFKRIRPGIENILSSPQQNNNNTSNGLFFRSSLQPPESLEIEHLRQINHNLNEENHSKSNEIYQMKLKMEELERAIKQSVDENKVLKRAVAVSYYDIMIIIIILAYEFILINIMMRIVTIFIIIYIVYLYIYLC